MLKTGPVSARCILEGLQLAYAVACGCCAVWVLPMHEH